MGTIQPSRFLSHTGRILPGVRRVVNVPSPAAGADWSVTVPAGVTWRVISGMTRLITSATAGNRSALSIVTVDGILIWRGITTANIGSLANAILPIVVGGANQMPWIQSTQTSLWYDCAFYPQGAIIGTSTGGLQAGDQWSGISLWVEEVYFTDAQLSEIARTRAELDREIAQYEFQQAEQAQAGA